MIDEQDRVWARYALGVVAAATAVHWLLLAQGFAPLHFDESQYWSYGQDLDWGYYSKPPMIAWLIRLSTEIFGDTAFGVRALAPLLHAWIAWMIFASAARLFDARTGFWAALAYAAMPGVAVSSELMTTDPAMMAAWATALYALVRALQAGPAPAPATPESGGAGWGWWLLMGAAIGLGLLSKYTMIAFVGGALGYALFSRQGSWGHRPTDRTGPLVALAAALVVFAPNIWWNAQHDFASFGHVADNAKMGEGPDLNPGKGFEFFFAQAAVIGPILFGALIWMAVMKRWRAEWQYRLLMWLALPLPVVITVVAFLSRAHPNWAAPAYVAGVIAVVAWLLDRNLRGLLIASVVIGVVAYAGFSSLGGYYAERHASLPRLYDPFKKMRTNPPICEKALALAEGATLVSTDRKLLADCMFLGKLGFEDIRIWAPGQPGNHYQLAAPLEPSDDQQMLFVIRAPRSVADSYLLAFREVTILEEGRFATHEDRDERYVLARVKGFLGY